MTSVLIRDKREDIDTEEERRRSHKNGGKDCRDVATSQEYLSHWKLEKPGKDSPLEPTEGT